MFVQKLFMTLWNVMYVLRNVFATGLFAVFQGIVLASCKSILGYIFTSDEWVSGQREKKDCTIQWQICAFSYIFFCLQTNCGDYLKKPHSLHISTVLWCTSGMLLANRLNIVAITSCNQNIHIFFSNFTICVSVFPVCLLRDTCRIRAAENCCLVQPGVLLLHWCTSGTSSNFPCPA